MGQDTESSGSGVEDNNGKSKSKDAANDAEKLYTLSEAAVYLGISQPTMSKRVAAGEIKPVPFGARRRPLYFRKADLDKYLKSFEDAR